MKSYKKPSFVSLTNKPLINGKPRALPFAIAPLAAVAGYLIGKLVNKAMGDDVSASIPFLKKINR